MARPWLGGGFSRDGAETAAYAGGGASASLEASVVELVAADVERPGAADGSTGSGISKFLIFRDIQAMSWPVGSLRWMKPAATAFWRRGRSIRRQHTLLRRANLARRALMSSRKESPANNPHTKSKRTILTPDE